MYNGLLLAPPVNISPNKGFLSQITAWFTSQHIASLLVAVIAVAIVWTIWGILKSHPFIFVILVIGVLVAIGWINLKHTGQAGPPPIVPLPKGR